jgi:hypothetical protein
MIFFSARKDKIFVKAPTKSALVHGGAKKKSKKLHFFLWKIILSIAFWRNYIPNDRLLVGNNAKSALSRRLLLEPICQEIWIFHGKAPYLCPELSGFSSFFGG